MAININYGAQSDYVLSKAPSVAVVAGFGSGKTFSAFIKILSWLNNHPGVPMGYFAPTYGLIRDIFVPTVEEFCVDNDISCNFSKSDNTMHIQGFAPIYCRSMQLPDTIVGFKIGHAAVDEIDIMPTDKAWQSWRKIKARCRIPVYEPGKPKTKNNEIPNQLALASTPEGYRFAYHAFKKEPIPGSELYQMSTYDNEHNLPSGYIEELKANYPAQLIDAYIEGKFTNLTTGRVWISYDKNKCRKITNVQPHDALVIGIDFNVNRGCAVIYVEREECMVAVDEVTGTTDTADTIRVIKERYPKHAITAIPDASGSARKSVNATVSDIALLRNAGFRVLVNSTNPNIKDRVTAMNAALENANGERKVFVNDLSCPHFSEGLEQQVYDSNGLPEKGAGKFDDIADAGSYPIAYLYPIQQRSTLIKVVAG